ncbi:MAG: PAS domain S-box protein, partial [Methylobacterium sp.]|nr:PAS domain S-box protein [Methylobacterium sp.]
QLRLRTGQDALAGMRSRAPELVLFAGLGFAMLLAAMFAFWLRSAHQQIVATEMQMRWQFAIEGSGLGLWDWNIRTDRVYYSRRWKDMLGYADDEIGDRLDEWKKLTHPDDAVAIESALSAHFRHKTPMYECEHRMLCKDGTYKWILDRGKVMQWDEDDKPLRMLGTQTDISKRKLAELALSENARFIGAILDNIADTIVTIDSKGTIQSVNKAVRGTFGFTPEELIGHNIGLLLPREQAALDARGMQPSAPDGESHAAGTMREAAGTRKDGTEFPVRLGWSELFFRDERLLIGLIHDIAESKRIEQELKAGRETAQNALSALEMQRFALDQHAIVAITDTSGRITYANQKFCEISGYSREELLGEDHRILNSGHHPRSFFSDLYRTVSAGEVWHAEICNRNKKGGLYWVDTTVVPFLGPDGKPQQYVAIRTDISERKRHEEELTRYREHLEDLVAEQTSRLVAAKEAAEHANQAKSEFLANMSHELRTPVHAILSFSELGEDKTWNAPADKVAGYFQRIRNAGERLLVLLNDLLDLSKLEAGKMQIKQDYHDLLALTLEALSELDTLMARKRIELRLQPVACDTKCEVDALRIGQVLRNLLSNAIKFTPEEGKVEIRMYAGHIPHGQPVHDGRGEPALVLEISDSGVGIPEHELEAIFDKFFQSSKTKSGAGGTGLGLAICKEIVEAHRGSIMARNNPAGGATFVMSLPYSALVKEIT